MALPNLSTLSLEVSESVDTEAREEDVFEFNEQVDQDDPFLLHYDAWTGPSVRGPIRKNRKSLRSLLRKKQEVDPSPRAYVLDVDNDEPGDTIPNDYLDRPGYFEDKMRKELKWGFLFRQQRYSFSPWGVRDSRPRVGLPERVQLKERFERKDGLATTCLRTMWRGPRSDEHPDGEEKPADVFTWTTATAVYKLKKAIEDWHSLCYVVNGRDDVLGVMALGQLTRTVDLKTREVTVSNHQLKLPSEWIDGMRKLIQKKGINRPMSVREATGQGNYTPQERFEEVQQRKLDFYIEWVCTASDEHVLNLPDQFKVRGVGKALLDGLKQFVRNVYIDPCARAFLVEQWVLPDLEAERGTHYVTMQPNSNQRIEAGSVEEHLEWARTQIERWAFFDFIALDSAKGAWKSMDFCQSETNGPFRPWNEVLKLADYKGYYNGVAMYLPLEGFKDDYRCQDGYTAPPPRVQP